MRSWITLVENALDMTPYEGSGPLFHGTDLINLYGIIEGDNLNQSIDQEHNPKRAGVSLTYSERMAWGFAERSSECFESNHVFDGRAPITGAIIGFDADKLRAKYRLVNYWDDPQDDEKEVRVLAKRIENLSQYLTMISFHVPDLTWFGEHLKSEYGTSEHGGAETFEALAELTKHPLFRPR